MLNVDILDIQKGSSLQVIQHASKHRTSISLRSHKHTLNSKHMAKTQIGIRQEPFDDFIASRLQAGLLCDELPEECMGIQRLQLYICIKSFSYQGTSTKAISQHTEFFAFLSLKAFALKRACLLQKSWWEALCVVQSLWMKGLLPWLGSKGP